jgi:hypothetical protein
MGQKQPAWFAFKGVLSPSMGRQKLSRGQPGYWLAAQGLAFSAPLVGREILVLGVGKAVLNVSLFGFFLQCQRTPRLDRHLSASCPVEAEIARVDGSWQRHTSATETRTHEDGIQIASNCGRRRKYSVN